MNCMMESTFTTMELKEIQVHVIIAPNSDSSVLQMTYQGQDELKLVNGHLAIENTFNRIVETLLLLLND